MERFWDKVHKTSSCWIWTAAKNQYGYGVYWLGGDRKLVAAHRVSFVAAGKEIPPGMDLDHLCRNRACVRPDHLEVVTRAENLRRGRLHREARLSCERGHEWVESNIYVDPKGRRECRTCRAERSRQHYRRREH